MAGLGTKPKPPGYYPVQALANHFWSRQRSVFAASALVYYSIYMCSQ